MGSMMGMGATRLETLLTVVAPASPIGDDTVSAMQAGIVLGYLDLVEGLVRRIRAALATTAPVIATGGLAPLFQGMTSVIDHYEPALTLQGLRLVYERHGGFARSV
ncbi:MAG: type III pantothenate kinase [Caldilineales bacterium]|nr:type III pantothenate kinase [Caldilineales bacterium]